LRVLLSTEGKPVFVTLCVRILGDSTDQGVEVVSRLCRDVVLSEKVVKGWFVGERDGRHRVGGLSIVLKVFEIKNIVKFEKLIKSVLCVGCAIALAITEAFNVCVSID